MNAPFQPEAIVPILASVGVSISDLKRNPAAVVEAARQQQVAILNRNRPVAYVIAPHIWERLCGVLDDLEDAELARERLTMPGERIDVAIDDLV